MFEFSDLHTFHPDDAPDLAAPAAPRYSFPTTYPLSPVSPVGAPPSAIMMMDMCETSKPNTKNESLLLQRHNSSIGSSTHHQHHSASMPPRCPPTKTSRASSSSSLRRMQGKSQTKLTVTTNLPPPAGPPPNKPLPPRPMPVPSSSSNHHNHHHHHHHQHAQQHQSPRHLFPTPSSHAGPSHHHSHNSHHNQHQGHHYQHPQQQQQQHHQIPHHAYPSPDPVPSAAPESMAERYLSRHQLLEDFTTRYQLGQELGSGGFGFVCSAYRLLDGREVAVKFILKSKVPAQGWARDADLGVVPMEVFMLKNIQHDNVIDYIEFFEDATFFYLITELHGAQWTSSRSTETTVSSTCSSSSTSFNSGTSPLSAPPSQMLPSPTTPTFFHKSDTTAARSTPGGMVASRAPASPPLSPMMMPKLTRRPSMDLFECIEQHDRLSESQARFVFRQIISAIKHLHALGIVHRDIKDENILVDEQFRVKLIDFGSAAFIPQQPTAKLFDRFLGTIQYASPEILRGEKYRGPEAEIWALGCCLYIMLNGEVPFTTPQQAAHHAYSFPKHRISLECLDLLDTMLEKKPSRRGTIHDVANHPWLNNPN